MPLHLRKAKLTRVSIEANSGICRGMLRHRYNDTKDREKRSRPTTLANHRTVTKPHEQVEEDP